MTMTARDLEAMARKLLDKLDLEPNVANLDDAYHALASARAEGAGEERARVVGLVSTTCLSIRDRDNLLLEIEAGPEVGTVGYLVEATKGWAPCEVCHPKFPSRLCPSCHGSGKAPARAAIQSVYRKGWEDGAASAPFMGPSQDPEKTP